MAKQEKQTNKPSEVGDVSDVLGTLPAAADTPPATPSEGHVFWYVAPDRVVYGRGGRMASGSEVRDGVFDKKTFETLREAGTVIATSDNGATWTSDAPPPAFAALPKKSKKK